LHFGEDGVERRRREFFWDRTLKDCGKKAEKTK